jgi:uncharacterized membrane protein (TIGR02234 family)
VIRRTGRSTVVLASAVASVLLLVASTRPWLSVTLSDALAGDRSLDVPGSRAAPVVPALALVALASTGALTIARRAGQVVALLAVAIAGLGAAAALVWVLADPGGAARAAVAEATGVTADSVTAGTASAVLTPWPVVALILAVALVAVAAWAWMVRRSWSSTQRFESALAATAASTEAASTEREPEPHPADTWEALSRGEDPTRDGGARG